MSLIKQVQVYTTTDGKQFEDLATAEAHQVSLENAEVVSKIGSSYVNIAQDLKSKATGLVGRSRAFNQNVVEGFLSFLISKGLVDKELLEAFEAIPQSEDLVARIAAEELRVKDEADKKAAAKAAAGETSKTDAPADAPSQEPVTGDLFGAE